MKYLIIICILILNIEAKNINIVKNNKDAIITIINETLGKNAQKEMVENISGKLILFFQSENKKTDMINIELRNEIKRLLKQLDGKSTIEEILAEERRKRKSLQKEIAEFKKSNPKMSEVISQLNKAFSNFRYKEYHDIIDNYTRDKNSAKLKYLSAKEYFDRVLYDQALKEIKKSISLDEEKTDKYIALYSQILYTIGEYDKALEYYQKSLKIREKVYGKEHPKTAISYNNIGLVYDSKGEYNKALEYYQKSLKIREKVYGKEHPDTAESYNNIGSVYNSKGEYDKALEYYQKSLKICEKVYGKEHPSTATSYNNISILFYKMQKYQESYDYMQKAINIWEKVLPSNHPNLKNAKNGLKVIKLKLK
jgi:tetratricopeptide (TPR) repeat protein